MKKKTLFKTAAGALAALMTISAAAMPVFADEEAPADTTAAPAETAAEEETAATEETAAEVKEEAPAETSAPMEKPDNAGNADESQVEFYYTALSLSIEDFGKAYAEGSTEECAAIVDVFKKAIDSALVEGTIDRDDYYKAASAYFSRINEKINEVITAYGFDADTFKGVFFEVLNRYMECVYTAAVDGETIVGMYSTYCAGGMSYAAGLLESEAIDLDTFADLCSFITSGQLEGYTSLLDAGQLDNDTYSGLCLDVFDSVWDFLDEAQSMGVISDVDYLKALNIIYSNEEDMAYGLLQKGLVPSSFMAELFDYNFTEYTDIVKDFYVKGLITREEAVDVQVYGIISFVQKMRELYGSEEMSEEDSAFLIDSIDSNMKEIFNALDAAEGLEEGTTYNEVTDAILSRLGIDPADAKNMLAEAYASVGAELPAEQTAPAAEQSAAEAVSPAADEVPAAPAETTSVPATGNKDIAALMLGVSAAALVLSRRRK
ncbi:MAG: hypothetical protein J6F31_07480 [Oscillospiraceae bacterium]|nr:hypothetical protein [Oscillospiraceae bacterium]